MGEGDGAVPVAWWQRALVGIATASSLAAAAWVIAGATPNMWGLFLFWGALPALPVFTRWQPAFRLACAVVTSVLLMAGIFLALVGFVVFVPSGLAVLCAGFANGRLTWPWGTASFLLGVTALGGWLSAVLGVLVHR